MTFRTLVTVLLLIPCFNSYASETKPLVDDVSNLYGFKAKDQYISFAVSYDPMQRDSIALDAIGVFAMLDVPMYKFPTIGGMLNQLSIGFEFLTEQSIVTAGAGVNASLGFGRGYDISTSPVGFGVVGSLESDVWFAYSEEGRATAQVLYESYYDTYNSSGSVDPTVLFNSTVGYGLQCNVGLSDTDPNFFASITLKRMCSFFSDWRNIIQLSIHTDFSLRSLNGSNVINR